MVRFQALLPAALFKIQKGKSWPIVPTEHQLGKIPTY